MLKKLGGKLNMKDTGVPIGEAGYPAPFKSTLEFNPPAHGVWNIVHTGMLLPGSHQIYICSANCMRGVVLTAAEMNAEKRFSQVLIEERDVVSGSIEKLTVEGVCDCLDKLPVLPKAVLIFTVCLHHFIGADLDWIYKELSRRYPDVVFIRCFMDPIMKKSGPTPDQKIRKSLYDAVKPLEAKPKTAALIGSDFAMDDTGDLKTLLSENGYALKELPLMETYEEYLSIGESALLIAVYPSALLGAEALSERLGRPLIYLPQTFNFDEIEENEAKLCRMAGLRKRSLAELREHALQAVIKLRKKTGDMEIAVDYTFHPRPLGLARLLLDFGFNVKRIYLDAVSGAEETDFYYLKEKYQDLRLYPTMAPECRVMHGPGPGEILALGQKAAWFTGARHFVNVVEGAGWYGYDGIIRLSEAMEEALNFEKDPEKFITLKGLGCESCVL